MDDSAHIYRSNVPYRTSADESLCSAQEEKGEEERRGRKTHLCQPENAWYKVIFCSSISLEAMFFVLRRDGNMFRNSKEWLKK